jgi:hypothetical protein
MCRKRAKTTKTKTAKKVSKSGKATTVSKAVVKPTTRPYEQKATAGKEKFESNKAREYSVSRKKKKKKKAKQAAARQAALEAQTPVDVVDEQVTEPVTPDGEAPQLPMDPVDETMGPQTGTETPDEPISQTDIETATGGTVGETTVTAQSIYQRDPEEAISDQERLAQEELRRQRIKRARAKQSLLRRRLERSREVGSGRRVLSGTERELNIQTRQAGTGRRRGAGRRSLITGSTGGIGYYSRFL